MDAEADGSELAIKQTVELALISISAVIETIEEQAEEGESPNPHFLEVRNGLASLLDRLNSGQIAPEHAEIELEKIEEMQEQWLRENPIPPD